MKTFLILLLFLLLFTNPISPGPTPDHQEHYLTESPHPHRHPQEYSEITLPLPSPPSCSHLLLRHSFAHTISSPPFQTPYTPPPHSLCPPPPWAHLLLHFHVTSQGQQYDRIAALWLAGVELLRTSTAQPDKHGIFWNVRKDVTRYSSLFTLPHSNLTMMLENIVNKEFTGIYHVTVTLELFKAPHVPPLVGPIGVSCERNLRRILRQDNEGKISGSLNWDESPADLIVPISDHEGDRGFWFRIDSEMQLGTRRIRIPSNAHRAVLELYVSFHGNDEFWYSNPPDSYIKANNLATGRGNGAYREVFVTIDGEVVGSETPFPVIFTGGINPLFWEPIVAIGAFNLPSYDMDLTPYLGKILDGKEHSFGIGVTRGISFWLVNANLHLWLDHESEVVRAERIFSKHPEVTMDRQEEFAGLDGSFDIDAQRETKVGGWVESSAGKFTTIIWQGYHFKNTIKFHNNGTNKVVKQKLKVKKKMVVMNGRGQVVASLKVKRKYPLRVITLTKPCTRKDRYLLVTNVTHALKEVQSGPCFLNSVSNKQDSSGWMEVKGHSVLSGQAITMQNYTHRDSFNCYSRNVAAANGKIVEDKSTFQCEE